MRLLFVSMFWPPVGNARSVSTAKLVAALVKQGVDCDVVCGEPSSAVAGGNPVETGATEVRRLELALKALRRRFGRRRTGPASTVPLGGGSPLTLLGGEVMCWRWAWDARRAALEMASRKHYDAVVSSTLPYHTCFPAWAVARAHGLPWVSLLFDPPRSLCPPPYRVEWWHRAIEWPLMRAVRRVLPHADHYLFSTSGLGEYLSELIGLPLMARGSVLPAVGWTAEAAEGRPRPGVELLHTGDLRQHLAPALLSALGRVREEALAQGGDVYVRQIGLASADEVAVVRGAGLGEAFVAQGYAPYLDCLRAIQATDALLLLEAGLGNQIFLPSKVADYAASGRPVLMWSPPDGPVAEMVGGFEHPGFMGQTEEGALRVLRGFVEDLREGRDLGRWALDAQRHSPEGVARVLLGVVEEAIRRRQGEAAGSGTAGRSG